MTIFQFFFRTKIEQLPIINTSVIHEKQWERRAFTSQIKRKTEEITNFKVVYLFKGMKEHRLKRINLLKH